VQFVTASREFTGLTSYQTNSDSGGFVTIGIVTLGSSTPVEIYSIEEVRAQDPRVCKS
jgi:hypothetical protein